jgi:hypothetical protein
MMKHVHRLYAGLCILLLGAYAWAEYQGQAITLSDLERAARGPSHTSSASHK